MSHSIKSLWTVQDIAEYLQVTRQTVYKSVICKPDFPKMVRVSRHPRWFPDEVQKWVRQQRDNAR